MAVSFNIRLLLYLVLVELPMKACAHPAKFSSWFPLLSASTYEYTSSEICNATLAEYRQSLHGGSAVSQAATCSYQQRCILQNLHADISARMSSANVLLGLTPGLLASIAPSVSEISLLSIHQPVLSMLISLGCPAVFPSRVLEYSNAQDVLSPPTVQLNLRLLLQRRPILSRILFVAKYVVLGGASFNIFYTSWQLGTKTVVSFSCVSFVLPLVWTSLSLAIHIVAASAIHNHHFHLRRQHSPDTGMAPPRATPDDSQLQERIKPTNSAIFLNYIATFLGFLHVTFGIMIFSSLQFIEVIDVITVILRYMVSTLVSRGILMHELNSTRRQYLRPPESDEDPTSVDSTSQSFVQNLTQISSFKPFRAFNSFR